MDFQKVLEALDHLIEKRVQSAAYTRMLTAIVQDIENSENNTYKVSYDNGQTITIAVSIAPNGNEIQYQKGDSVQLLQYNGIGNTNTTLYILGKSKDFTEQDWVDLDDYFSSLTVFPIDEFDTEKNFTLQDGTSVIENIKEYGSFILKAKFTVDNSNKVYNYGIKITLNFTNNIKSVEYIFDIYQMIGQPWLYQNMEQSYQQKIDDFYLPYLESITLTKFVDEGHSITISDMEISSAILNVSNDYTAMFRGSKKSVDFITDHQDNKASTTLQTIFYKNSQTFASSSCKYYWFIRDDSIAIDNEYYHKYGGIGWKCLNSYETVEYLNETPQKIFNNDIGDTLIVDQNNAPHYHNYYKCIVEYGLRIAATQEREILNLDKTNINFTLTTENTTITKLDENTILNLTLNVSGDLSILKKIGWYYQRDDEDRQHLISFENTKDTVKQYVLNVLGLNDKLGKDFTIFTCVLLGEGSVTLGQSHITIIRDLSGDFKEEIWYHDNGDSIVPPTSVNTIDGTWTKEIPSNAETKYIFAASRLVSATYQGPFGDIYCYSAHGTGPAAAQLTEFNKLTNNGKDDGLYYSQGTENKLYINASYINTGTLRVGSGNKEKFFATIEENESGEQDVRIGGFTVDTTSLNWVNPKDNTERVYLGQEGLIFGDNKFKIDPKGNITWSNDNSPVTYEAILSQLKEKDQDGIYAIKNDSGKRVSIGINASAINTGALLVGQDINNCIFYANIDNNAVKIGGFTVDNTSLQWQQEKGYVYLGQEGLKLGNNKFKIDQEGNITWGTSNPVSYDSILNNIKEKDDGIYAITDSSGTRTSIGINASAIKTGIFSISSPKDEEGNQQTIFYANATPNASNNFYIDTSFFKIKPTGEIIATEGTIGPVTINDTSLTIGEISIIKDQIKFADNAAIEKGQIGGLGQFQIYGGDTAIQFNGDPKITAYNCNFSINASGYSGLFGGWAKITFVVKLTLNQVLNKDIIFTINASLIEWPSERKRKHTICNRAVFTAAEQNESISKTVGITFDHGFYGYSAYSFQYDIAIDPFEFNGQTYSFSFNNDTKKSGSSQLDQNQEGSITVTQSYSTTITQTKIIQIKGSLIPMQNAIYDLGINSKDDTYFWNIGYIRTVTNSSDKKIKNNITLISDQLAQNLIYNLKPKQFMFNSALTPRYHYGFIAQDVEALMKNLNMTTGDNALICKSEPDQEDNENNFYSLNYIEFVPLLVSTIQSQNQRLQELESQIQEIKGEI